MQLTHFALALTLILLGITGYLAWEGQQEARGARQELEFLRKQQQNQLDAGAVPSSGFPSINASQAANQSAVVPDAPVPVTSPAGSMPAGSAPVVQSAAPAPLTPLQRKVLQMPAVAQVTDYQRDHGFVVIGAGASKGIATGSRFDLRRDSSVVGRIAITMVEANEAIGDLDPRSVPPGVTVQAGDEVIQVVNPL